MEIEDYYTSLDTLAGECENHEKSANSFIEDLIKNKKTFFDDLIAFRQTLVGAKELDEVRGYMSLGFFPMYSGMERATCFVICFELGEIVAKKGWRKRCETYVLSQPLFSNSPKLFDFVKNGDLIDSKVLNQIDDSEILQIEGGYTYLDREINPSIVSWTLSNFQGKRIFLRANPHSFFKTRPLQFITESVLMPANPNWWRNLTIHNRTKEGASYVLDDCAPKDNLQQYWEFHVKKINRLEVIAKRSNNGNLSMMIEEISHVDGGLMFGRCIHLDTDSKYGSPFDNSVLNHLDLAINVYEGDIAQKRLNDNLANGVVTTDASYRTHLLRLEEIPFKSLFAFVTSFFKSKTLVNEWFDDQFREENTSKSQE